MKMKPGAAKLQNNQKSFIRYVSSLPKPYNSFVSEADWNFHYLLQTSWGW